MIDGSLADPRWWINAAADLGAPVVVLVAGFWWATTKLIPKLQQESTEARLAFAQEMASERKVHQDTIERIVKVNEKAVDGLLDHVRSDHAVAR